MPYSSIQSIYTTASPGDTGTWQAAFDAMAAMEKATMGFLGLKESWGVAPPKQLNGEWPNVLRVPAGDALLTNLTYGGLDAFTGGKRERWFPFAIFCFVGTDTEDYGKLSTAAAVWPDAFDLAYCAYPSLNGAVRAIGLRTATWGSYPYGWTETARVNYWGWKFTGRLLLHRSARVLEGT